MVLIRWDPYREIRRADELNRRWRGFDRAHGFDGWRVPLDVIQDADSITVQASLPGMKPEEINVTIEDSLLTIEAGTEAEHEEQNGSYLVRERRSGKLHRALRLPESVDSDNVESRYENGVLTITLPKVEAKKAKQIEVKAA